MWDTEFVEATYSWYCWGTQIEEKKSISSKSTIPWSQSTKSFSTPSCCVLNQGGVRISSHDYFSEKVFLLLQWAFAVAAISLLEAGVSCPSPRCQHEGLDPTHFVDTCVLGLQPPSPGVLMAEADPTPTAGGPHCGPDTGTAIPPSAVPASLPHLSGWS